MKPFRFGAQPLLDWRRRQAEQLQAALAAIEGARERLDAVAVESRRESEAARSAALASERIDPVALRHAAQWAESLARRSAAARAESQRLASQAAAKRGDLVSLSREVRVLERLRERRLCEWRRAYDREIESQAAELFLARRRGR